MKKATIILVVLLLVSLSLPCALAKTDKEVVFRNVPWGSSYREAVTALDKDGLSIDSGWKFDTYTATAENLIFDEFNSFDYSVGFYKTNAYNAKPLSVAGYEVEDTKAYFVFVPSADGSFPADEENSVFFAAEYELEVKDVDAVLEDLKGKLSSLYGNDFAKKETDFIFQRTWYSWKDDQGNIVSLQGEKSDRRSKIHIWYTWGGANDLLQSANDRLDADAKAQEALNFETNNTDGL